MRTSPWLIAVVAAVLATSCSKNLDGIRVGVETNLSCAPEILAAATDAYGSRVDVPVRTVSFGSGPLVAEALVKGDLEAACLDPVAASFAALKSKGMVVVIAGVSSGGGALVVSSMTTVATPLELSTANVFTPQLGSVYDTVARQYFAELGFGSRDQGGEFQISPASHLDVVPLLRRRNVTAAWVGEPWTSVLVEELSARTVLEQTEAWKAWTSAPDAAAVLVVRARLLRQAPEVVDGLLQTHIAMIEALNDEDDAPRDAVAHHLTIITQREFPERAMKRSWSRMSFSPEIPDRALDWYAAAAHRQGFIPGDAPDMSRAVDGSALDRVLEKRVQ